MRLPLALAVVLAAPAASADNPRISGEIDFEAGTMDAGDAPGTAAPAGHIAVGRELGNVRLQGEFDVGMWTDDSVPNDAVSGSMTRVGAGVRWHWLALDRGAIRLYVEASVGQQWISAPHIDVRRDDLAVGFGFAQQESLGGKTWLGGHSGIRMMIAGAPAASAACRGTCTTGSRIPDVALMYVLGVELGR
jgi:hypothetical protein